MRQVGTELLNRLRNIYDPDDPAPVRKPVDLYEFYAHDYEPPAGEGFDPADALQRFAAINIVWGGQFYMRKVVSRGTIRKIRGQETNSVNVSFSNVDEDRYLATWAQTEQIEGMWLVIRYAERDILDDSDVLFVGKAGKPGTINNKSFSIQATSEVGNLNQMVPKYSFLAEDPMGRDPSDPLYEGIRFVAVTGNFTFSQIIPAQNTIARFFGQRDTIRVTRQFSSVDGTPYGDPIPEYLGRCQGKLIPFIWMDHGEHIGYNMAACRGPIVAIANLKTITQGFSDPVNSVAIPPAPPEIHLGDPGGTGTNAAGWIQFPSAGLFSRLAGISAASTGSKPDVTDGPPEVTALIKGRLMSMPDDDGVFNLTGWSDNPVIHTRWFFTEMMGVSPGLMEDPVNFRTVKLADRPVIDRSNSERIFLPTTSEVARFRSSGIIDARFVRGYRFGESGYLNGEAGDSTLVQPVTETWNPGDPLDPIGDPADIPTSFGTQKVYRKAFTFNAPIMERIKALDFLYQTLYPAFGGYHIMNVSGRTEIRMETAADNCYLRATTSVGATTVFVDDVTSWKRSLQGRIHFGFGLITSENRIPSAVSYTSSANSIPLAAAGTGITATASGATLSGGNTTTQASGTVTLAGSAGAGGTASAIIDGIVITYMRISS